MKIYIPGSQRGLASGGSFKFLSALCEYCKELDVWDSTIKNCDVIIANAFLNLDEVIKIKRKFPEKIVVHRIDGPVRLYNTESDKRDLITYTFNDYFADATVFQSNWSRKNNYLMGLGQTPFTTSIMNAPDPTLFMSKDTAPHRSSLKIRIIASSWSSNIKKGFDVYQWLDEHLDFNRYEMTFVGNSPIIFKNIHHIPPLNSTGLAAELMSHDIYLTASKNDPCSNALIEAMHCGLPALALNEGGHPEIVGKGGELFDRPDQIPELLGKIYENYESYKNAIDIVSLSDVGRHYVEFIESIYVNVQQGEYLPKQVSRLQELQMKSLLYAVQVENKFKAIRASFRQRKIV